MAYDYDPIREELEYEWNARYDYVQEAYGASELDPVYEGWCDHCMDCEQTGEDPGTYEEFEASLKTPSRYVGTEWIKDADPDEDIPF